jgi:RimJ/RimL family protein N-acetyltransferase
LLGSLIARTWLAARLSVVYKIGMALRDVEESDLPIFFEHQRDPEANRMAAFPAREWDAFVTHWRAKILGNPSAGKQTIVVDDNVVGNVLAWDQDGKRFVAYWIDRKYWGQGVATAALMEYLQHEERRPLHAYVVVHNVGSVRVLEKCGFRRVGEPEAGPDGVQELLFQLDG